MPAAVAAEIESIDRLAALAGKEEAWRTEDAAIAGAVLIPNADGSMHIERSFVRAVDEPAAAPVEATGDGGLLTAAGDAPGANGGSRGDGVRGG